MTSQTENLNTGHGWVRPRPDGMKARCGGPRMCKECSAEAANLKPDTRAVFGVAIKRGNLICWLPKPARHHDLIREMAEAGIKTPIGHGDDIQGFMTEVGFKDRQLTGSVVFGHRRQVTSEDLW